MEQELGMKRVFYKIFRKRQEQTWWTDITSQFSPTSELTNYEESIAYAVGYKTIHKSDVVKLERYTVEEIILKG